MEKRVTLAIVLCVVVLFVWQYAFAPQRVQRRQPQQPPAGPQAPNGPAKAAPEVPQTAETALTGPPAQPEKPAEPKRPAVPARTFVVDTDAVRCVLTNCGAAIESLRLKNYHDLPALSEEARAQPEHWLEVLRVFQPGRRSLALALKLGDLDLAGDTWACVAPPARDGDVTRVTFEYVLPDGVRLQKEFRFRNGLTGVDLVLRAIRAPGQAVGPFRVELTGAAGIFHETAMNSKPLAVADLGESEPLVIPVTDLAEGDGWRFHSFDHRPIRYLGVIDKYFLSILALPPDVKGPVRLRGARAEAIPDEAGLDAEVRKLRVDPRKIAANHMSLGVVANYDIGFEGDATETTAQFTLYAGPRRWGELEAAGLGEYEVVLGISDYSVCGLGALVLPISALNKFLLNLFYSVIHNYGVAILLLTLLVRICMFPLTRKQMVSMHQYQQKIGKIKPELDKLNEKYKADPRKKQQQLMKLYKENNISVFPMMGCLPLFVNIPVFFGLFHALRTAMELRHAPFVGWIKDLSAPDALITFAQPYSFFGCLTIESFNVLPLIMGVTWFAQMYFAPRPSDPQQAQTQKMMMFMPVMFMFMLYNFAAGLSLYWTFNSLLALIEQRFIKRGHHFQPAPASGPTPK